MWEVLFFSPEMDLSSGFPPLTEIYFRLTVTLKRIIMDLILYLRA